MTGSFRVRGRLAMEDFGRCHLIILSVVFSVRADTVHLTMVTPTPYGAGSSASISCFRSSPDEDVTLNLGRPFQIGLGGSTVQTSTTLPAGSTQSMNGQAVTWDLTSSNDATGLFYCEGSNRGLTTRVYSIIHSIHRRFEPRSGLVTRIINKGEGVTLIIDSVNSGTQPLWRRIRQGTSTNLDSYTNMYNITMPSSMVSDGDLYAAIHHALSLNDNHFSLIRLIVRDCVSDKWGPSACVAMCDMCYNGGVCDDETGDCVCSPGFSGPNCLTACGMHRFGWSCEFQCGPGNIIQSCTGSQFGLPDPYGNSCISGYHGRDCNVVCSSGMFGAGCTQTCHCQSGMCDAYTGVCTTPCSSGICSSSACTQGWLGSNCQIPDECPAGYYGEQCLSKCNCFNAAACDRISGYCSGGCASGFTCVTNPCTHSPCLNGGSCSIQGSTFSCTCPSPYVGIRCESGLVPCTPNPCMNGGTCRAQGFMFSCTCLSGYSGSTCEIFDPCYSNPCLNGGACRAQGSMFSCICQSGYSGITCEILSPCSSSPCQHGGTCSVQGSTFNCNCQYPYSGNTCEIFIPCSTSPCQHGGTCSAQGSTFSCYCQYPYSGNTCEIFNPCSTSPCQHGGTCSAQGSTFSCTCPPDYTGNNCEAFIFQIACSSGVTVFGTPGMTTSVEIPQPFVSSGFNNIHFTYMGPQGIIATPTSYQVPVPLTGSTTVDIHITARGPFNIIQRSCQISVTVTGFQMMCTPNISVVGSPGSNVSVAIPEPTVSGGVEGVTFAYMVESASIPTPSSYDVIVPDTGSTIVMVNVIPVVSFSNGMSCNISVIIKGLPYLNQTPSVSFESGSARVTWQAWNTSSGDRGVGPVIAYKVYYSLGSPVSWSVTGTISVTDPSQSTYSFTVQPLELSTEYMFSVAAVGEGIGEGSRSPAFTGLSLPLPITTTERDTSKETTVTEGLPYLSQTPSVIFGSRSATVTWQAWNTSSGDRGAGPVIAYKLYYSLASPISWIAAGTISVTDPFQSTYSFKVQPLEPSTEYMFSVAAVGDGTEGSRSPSVAGLTIPLPPTSTDSNLPIESTVTEVPTVLHSTPASSSNTAAITAVVVVVLVMATVAVGLIIFCLHRHRRNRKGESSAQSAGEREMSAYQNKIASDVETTSSAYEKVDHVRPSSSSYEIVGLGPSSSSTYEDVSLPSWAHQWGIPWQNVIVGEKVLGSGNFGEVLDGVVMIEGEFSKAAIKTLRTNASPHDRQLFMEEFRTLTKLGSHPNIVNLLGACQHKDNLYVTLEYLPNGDLRSYLRNARTQGDSGQTSLSSEKLIQFALDVAKGMKHLAALGVIHRDLAARNILLSDDLVAKVSDFGLSRGEDIYVQTSKTRVPTRWLSLESLLRQVYTSKSDVWSFGILLWEIATLGATPYKDITSKDLPSRLENGYRMPKPSNCDDEIYGLMMQCWREDPKERPVFKKLTSILKTMAENQIEKTYVRLLPKSDDYMHLMIRPELDDN